MRWGRYFGTSWGKGSIYRALEGKHEGKGTNGSPRCGWEVTTKLGLK